MSLGNYAFQAIEKSLKINGLGHIPLVKRHEKVNEFCMCFINYNTMRFDELKKRFSIKKV